MTFLDFETVKKTHFSHKRRLEKSQPDKSSPVRLCLISCYSLGVLIVNTFSNLEFRLSSKTNSNKKIMYQVARWLGHPVEVVTTIKWGGKSILNGILGKMITWLINRSFKTHGSLGSFAFSSKYQALIFSRVRWSISLQTKKAALRTDQIKII